MDRSFLSQPEVVAASRDFVCIRLATYESEEEAQVMRHFFVGGSGQMENTTFAMVAPDGRTPLVRSGRSPDFAFRDAHEMALWMTQTARRYNSSPIAPRLPVCLDTRVALDVAACDGLPLVVAYGPDAASLSAVERALGPLSWSSALIGRAVYARTTRADDFRCARVRPTRACVVVIAPGKFGVDGTVVAAFDADSRLAARLRASLPTAVTRWVDIDQHIRSGRQAGIHWETAIPNTDPNEAR